MAMEKDLSCTYYNSCYLFCNLWIKIFFRMKQNILMVKNVYTNTISLSKENCVCHLRILGYKVFKSNGLFYHFFSHGKFKSSANPKKLLDNSIKEKAEKKDD